MSRFIHLHTHSHYSLLSGLPKIPELIAAAKGVEMPALALTDNGNLYGAIEFYKAARAAGIKPIIGVDAYVAARKRTDKEARIDNRRTRLVLLAENLDGYQNLLKLVTASNLEGFYYKPRVDRELLARHRAGLIAIIPMINGETTTTLRSGDEKKAEETIAWYKNTFGAENVFLELTHHPEAAFVGDLFTKTCALAKKTGTPLVAGHEVYYLSPEDRLARTTLLSVSSGGEMDRNRDEEELDLSFVPPEEMVQRFADVPEAIEASAAIAERVNLELPLGRWVFPRVKTTGGQSHDEELQRLVEEGVARRRLTETKEVGDRILYELGIIKHKSFAPYFLVVADLLRFAHEHGILTTTRGSAAGSLVSYLAGITNVNPLAYKLPFERFLNMERPTPPDIDMDIADNRRDEMIEYAKKTYGADRVAQIGTFGTMMARGAVRDVARALGYEYGVGDKIAKLIPFGSQGFPMFIDKALEIVPELKALYKQEKEARAIIDMAKKIEGCARHISVHAAGVVISPTPLTDFTPLQLDPKGGKLITEYDMYAIEEVGLLKLDFLGIRNLAILADAVKRAEKFESVSIDIENIPLDDKKTFEMLARGETGGLFQLSGSGMTRYLKDLRPTTIHDINAMVALYRPGPMENIPRYIERKHNPSLVRYLDPRLRDILANSYGVITYQDDVLLVATKLAGYSWQEADKLRKAMGKKIPAEMEAQKEKLLAGLVKNGMTKEKAEEMWKLIEPFAAYGFNKAHAASYGKVAYQTAYMKANFPALYMAAVLTAESGDPERIGEIIGECARIRIPVLPPAVNESSEGFTVVRDSNAGDKIRFGLTTIKNFGEGISHTITAEREGGGRFKTLGEFLRRITDRNLNKKSLEALIKAGALDEFGDRAVLLGNLDQLLEYNKEAARAPANQTSLFGDTGMAVFDDVRLSDAPPASVPEKLAWEKELLGFYLSGHPLDMYRELLEKREVNVKRTKEEFREGMEVVLGGIIENARRVITKRNDEMMFLKLADLTGSMEVVVFPRVLAEFKELLIPEHCIAIKGRISHRNGEVSLIAEKVKELAKQ